MLSSNHSVKHQVMGCERCGTDERTCRTIYLYTCTPPRIVEGLTVATIWLCRPCAREERQAGHVRR